MKNLKLKSAFIQHQRSGAGFTLIELLIVISIIGILAVMAMTGFSSARKGARDTTRKSDLKQYQVAVEAYYSNNNAYPTQDGHSHTPSGIFADTGPIITEILPEIIEDPIADQAKCISGTSVCLYSYYTDDTGTKYKLIARLETGGYWIICSGGKSGKVDASIGWTGGIADENCNL